MEFLLKINCQKKTPRSWNFTLTNMKLAWLQISGGVEFQAIAFFEESFQTRFEIEVNTPL